MTSKAVIVKNPYRIDFANLCGGNDFAALTNNYNRNSINDLVWSIPDDTDRIYAYKAICLQKKKDNCPETDDELYESILGNQLELQREYNKEKISKSNTLEQEKIKGYNTTEIGVLMYFICDKMGIYMRNDDCKNCEQKDAIHAIAKAFGFSETSFIDKLNLDFADSATRKAMIKVSTDFKNFMPAVSEEIIRLHEDYEDDYLRRKKKKK